MVGPGAAIDLKTTLLCLDQAKFAECWCGIRRPEADIMEFQLLYF